MQTTASSSASSSSYSSARDMDIVQRYLADVRRYDVLTREEERVLAQRFHETGDPEAERLLVNSNLRLVVKIALEYSAGRSSAMALIQEGHDGLMNELLMYDPDIDIRLWSFS